jgi:hypothetical protein
LRPALAGFERPLTPSVGEVDTTTNPDHTQLTDTYTQGLLKQAQTLSATGTPVTTDSFAYDTLQRNDATTDWTGTTTYTLQPDGSISGETLPDGRTSSIAADPNTDAPLATTRTDGTTANATFNTLGEQTSQSGAGQVPANFGYNQTTGQLNSITTFASGTLNSGTGATTSFHFDPNTGLPTATIYADGSQQDESYNSSGQLTNVQSVDPAGHYTSSGVLGYNTAGYLTSAAYSDYLAGGSNVTDAFSNIDDVGRAGITTETAQNPADATGASTLATASTQTFTTNQQLGSDKSGPSGATTVYAYYPNSGSGSTGGDASPGALESVKVVSAGTTLSETDYGYDQATGRMDKVTIVGQNGAANQVFNISFQSGTNLISNVSAPGSSTSFHYDGQNGRLTSENTAKAGAGNVYFGAYAYYNNDQRNADTVIQQEKRTQLELTPVPGNRAVSSFLLPPPTQRPTTTPRRSS